MTSKTTEKPASEGRGVEELDEQIEKMEAELADGYGKPLTWDEVTSTTAEEIARQEQRRSILPRLIHAARIKRLELEKRGREEEAETLRAKLEPAYAEFQAKEDELRKAKERRDSAQGEWAVTLSAVQSAEGRVQRTEQELRELRGSR